MHAIRRIAGSLPRRPLAVLAMAIAFAIASQVLAPRTVTRSAIVPVAVDAPGSGTAAGIDPLAATGVDGDLDRIRANIAFWSARSQRSPRDFISATRWAESEIELARATGDLTAYTIADQALTVALDFDPTYGPAIGYRGVVLVALHRFADAVTLARAVLDARPDDTVALATLGDGSLELGDLATARRAYDRLAEVEPSAAALVRLSHLAFIEGDPASAVDLSRRAVAAAIDDGLTGSSLAWYHYQLGEVTTSTGDAVAGAAAFEAALTADPDSYLARFGLSRIVAAAGDLGGAIERLDAAIERVPLPEFHARRADLYTLRGGPGDADRAATDRATVLVIAQLAGDLAGVRDRQLSVYLASHDLDPERALRLADSEIRVRQDVYGYDALAWALLANGRPMEAQAAMDKARSTGIRDARMLYHAGSIAIALGDVSSGRALLQASIDLDPTFDPHDVAQIRAILAAAP